MRVTAAFIVSFLLITAPWLWLNYVHHGSPLYNTNNLNMATEFYGYNVFEEGVTQAAMVFNSFGDVVLHDPKGFVLHYLVNIPRTIRMSLSSGFILLPIGLMALAAIPVVLIKQRQREIWVFVLSLLLYILVTSFTHWENRYHFYVLVCYVGLASYLLITTADWISDKGWLSRRMTHVGVVCAGIMAFYLCAMTSIKIIEQLIKDLPHELIEASKYLKSISVNGSRIVARKPHLSFMVNGVPVRFPQVKSIDELHESLKESQADYMVYEKITLARRPELKMLAEPVNTIPWLKLVYSDPQRPLVIYRIEIENGAPAESLSPAQ